MKKVCAVVLLSLLVLQGCAYVQHRAEDALEAFDLGFTVTKTPQFSAYANCPTVLPIGYGNIDGTYIGIHNGRAGWQKHQRQEAGFILWGRERSSWSNFEDERDVGVAGILTSDDRRRSTAPICIHYLHLGWLGVVWNIHWSEIGDFFAGIVGFDPLRDDGIEVKAEKSE